MIIPTSVEVRDEFLKYCESIKSLSNAFIFPTDIQITKIEAGTEANTSKLTLNRPLKRNNSDTIKISFTTGYDGSYPINDIAANQLTLVINKKFSTNETTGVILDTGHIYKDSIYEVKNLPAVLVEIDDINFEYDNAHNAIGIEYGFIMTIIDKIDNYTATTKKTSLENCQKFVQRTTLDLINLSLSSVKFITQIENMDTLQTTIDEDKKCSCTYARITINNR